MFGTASEEMEVNAPASEAWEIYGTLKLGKFIVENLPQTIRKIEVVQGDGGVGTILNLIFQLGATPGFSSYKEKFIKVDNEKRVKEVEVCEGGYLDMGFSLLRFRIEILEKSEKSCIIRSAIEYEVNEGVDASVAFVALKFVCMIMEAVAKYLLENKQT